MTDCIIVGGGAIGILTARCLHDAGARVLLLERGQLGREASWAAGGILSPLYPWRYTAAVTRLARSSQAAFPALAANLRAETGIDPEWTVSGLLVLDNDERAAALAWGQAEGTAVEVLPARAVSAKEPALAARKTEALWLPEIAQIRTPRLVKALRASLDARGVDYREHRAVTGLSIQQGRITGVNTATETFTAERVVIAGGAWSPQLVPQRPAPLDIQPVRGQMILFQARPETLRRLVLYRGHYLIPRRDGCILAGSTLEYTGFEKETTRAAREELRRAAVELLPALEDCPLQQHWSGLRPGSPAGMPYIGEHPRIRGLYANTGHFRNGIVTAPASAQLATDLVLGRQPELDPAPYALDAPH